MDSRVVLGITLITLPVCFNVLFSALAKSFDYPDILRHEPGQILTRFVAGGRRLVLLWWAFMLRPLWLLALGVTYLLDIRIA